MKNNILLQCVTLLLITLLSACANNTGPVVIRDSGHAATPPSPIVNKGVEPESFSRSSVRPVEPEQRTSSSPSPLKKKLMVQSEKKLQEDRPKACYCSGRERVTY